MALMRRLRRLPSPIRRIVVALTLIFLSVGMSPICAEASARSEAACTGQDPVKLAKSSNPACVAKCIASVPEVGRKLDTASSQRDVLWIADPVELSGVVKAPIPPPPRSQVLIYPT